MDILSNRESWHGNTIRSVMSHFPLGYDVKKRTLTYKVTSYLLFNSPPPSCLICTWISSHGQKLAICHLYQMIWYIDFFFLNRAENFGFIQKREELTEKRDVFLFTQSPRWNCNWFLLYRILPKFISLDQSPFSKALHLRQRAWDNTGQFRALK